MSTNINGVTVADLQWSTGKKPAPASRGTASMFGRLPAWRANTLRDGFLRRDPQLLMNALDLRATSKVAGLVSHVVMVGHDAHQAAVERRMCPLSNVTSRIDDAAKKAERSKDHQAVREAQALLALITWWATQLRKMR